MNVALLGHGVVGRGVDEIVSTRTPTLAVTKILELPDRCTEPRMTSNFDDILNDEGIEAVVECMGGLEPAHTFIMQALSAGKHVVTSNKAVVAAYFEEFAVCAAEHGVSLFIEATCGGGIPWIAGIEKVRRIDEVESFKGILNGTTNYILDAMHKNDAEFSEVLAKAQELGYAERDPSADIDGIDVLNKTIISASVAFDVACTHDLPVTGIRTVSKKDMEMLSRHGRGLKLLGHGVCCDGCYAAAVEPVAVAQDSLEANVPDNFNLASVVGATIGELKFYGQGAGSLPTGNAMVQDLLDLEAGRRPSYSFGRELSYDETLISADYIFRTTAKLDAKAEDFDEGYVIIRNLNAREARELCAQALERDATTFMAAVPKEG